MNAITINLLAEEQLAQQARARDPIKGIILAGLSLVVIATASGTWLSAIAARKTAEVGALKTRLGTAQSASSSESEGTFKARKALAGDVQAINASRVLYAPQLALVKDLIPDYVQLTRIGLELATVVIQPVVDTSPEADEAKAKRHARPQTVERLVLRLDGHVFGRRSEIEVDNFLKALRTHESFSQQVDQIQLRSIVTTSSGTEAGTDAMPSASFVIECQYKERK